MNVLKTEHDEGSYHRALRERVTAWLASAEAQRTPRAELYRHLPVMYEFLLRLVFDPRVPPRERATIRAALRYIVAPYDYVPEGAVGAVGFRDDLVLAAMTVERLFDTCESAVLAEHWTAEGDPAATAREILDASGELVSRTVRARLAEWISD